MRLRDLVVIIALLASTVLISGLAVVMGSEVYFLLPSRRLGVDPPPDHPATYVVLLAVVVGLYFLSARYAAVLLAIVTAGAYLGTAVGWAAFEWTPSVCQYLLMISLTATTVFVWQCEELNSD